MKQWTNLEELKQWVSECDTIAELCRKLDLQPKGGNYSTVKKIITENGLDISHFKGKKSIKRKKGISRLKLSDVLEGNVYYGNSNHLKERLLNEGIKKWECECCHNTKWMDFNIPLELHHKNGDHYDNHLQNLELLCPNCHSLTDSYRGKKINKPLEELNSSTINTINKLKEKEKLRQEEIYNNKIKNGEIPKLEKRKEKIIKYCEYCGKKITGRGTRFCSQECLINFNKENNIYGSYDKNVLLEQSKTVHSLVELGKLYNITDKAIKKHLIKLNIFDQVKENFIKNERAVLQFDINNNFIKEWSSAKEAANALNLTKNKIQACCRNEQKSSGGFIWKYKN